MNTKIRGGAIRKLTAGYASGGSLLDGLKRAVGMGTPEQLAYRANADAERAAAKAAPTPAAAPTTAAAPAAAASAPTDIFKGTLERREAQAGLKGGGRIKGPSGAMKAMATPPQKMMPKPAPIQKGASPVQGDSNPGTQADIDAYREQTTGYKAGGAIKKMAMAQKKSNNGAKLKGPGTPTSDSIPAIVVDTGEPIKVATDERILSRNQNKALEREAKSQGSKSLDHKLVAMTGKPVGPTIKYVKSAGKSMPHAGGGFDVLPQKGPTIGTGRSGGGTGFNGAINPSLKIGVGGSGAGGGGFGGLDRSGPTLGADSSYGGGSIRRLADGGAIGLGQGWKTKAFDRQLRGDGNQTGDGTGYAKGGKLMKHCANGMNPLDYAATDMVPGSGMTRPGEIERSSKGLPGGGFGATVQKVPTFNKGGAIRKMATCSDGGTMRPQMRGYAEGGTVEKKTLADAIAYGTQFAGGAPQAPATPYTQVTPTSPTDGGMVGNTASKPTMADAVSYGKQFAAPAAQPYVQKAPTSPTDGGIVGEQNAVPVGRPAPQQSTGAAQTMSTPYQPSKDPNYAAGVVPRPATAPASPGNAATLMGETGKNVGGGVTRFDVAGKSPLFTNITDAGGMASNERLLNRGAPTAQDQGALDNMLSRQDIGNRARAQKAQYDAEVAGAKAINTAPERYDQNAGARNILDLAGPTGKLLANLPTDRNGKLLPSSEKLRDEIYKTAILGPQDARVADQASATTRRGQDAQLEGHRLSSDATRYTADSHAGTQRVQNQNAQEKLMLEASKVGAELQQKARVDQLDNLIINGNPLQQKIAANQKAMILGKGDAGGKQLSDSAIKGMLENQTNLRRAQTASDLLSGKTVGGVEGDPNATGYKGYLPNTLLNRVDPKGVDTRAAIADLGSLVVHDRSGAAVTAAEFPRLAPFIPGATDDAETAQKKLKMFTKNYQDVQNDAANFYKESGYKLPSAGADASGVTPQAQTATVAPPQLTELQRRAATNPALAQRLREMGH